ncbi:C1 family peptidase [Streptomyces sp. L2]|uniref:C1 family peptidase n=1 Tax=Streptomyces sp. L2 TaxID=2162665 RepID=UPI0010137FE7|nr:C1 family peptidase [Streptomyces sp. L2]
MTRDETTGSIDLGREFGPVLDQGPEPLCAPAVVAGLLWAHDIAVCVPCLGRMGAAPEDSGAGRTVASCLSAVERSGAPPADGTPDHSAHVPASAVRLRWSAVDGAGWSAGGKLGHIESALGAGHPVALQIGLYGSAVVRSGTGWLGMPETGEDRAGLHAVLCVGIVRHGPRSGLIVKNSWGADWGSGGYGIVSMGVLDLPETGRFVTVTGACSAHGQPVGLKYPT